MKNYTRKTLATYWQHAKKYKISFFVVILSVIGASATNAIVPIYFKKFFDVLTSGIEKNEAFEKMFQILLIILLIEAFHWIFWRIVGFVNSYFQTHVIADLDNSSFKIIHKHSFSFFNNNFTGSLVKKVNYFSRAFEAIADIITYDITSLITNITIITIVLSLKSPILGFVIILWVLAYMAINFLAAQYKLKYDIIASLAQTKLTANLADTITNNSNLKLFNGHQREVSMFSELSKRLRLKRRLAWNLENVFESIQSSLIIILEVGFMYIGLKLWQKGQFGVGDFVLLQSYALIVMMKIWNFGKVVRRIYQNLADAEEMTEIREKEFEIKDHAQAKNLVVKESTIEFQDVDFNYYKTRKVLRRLNLKIQAQEKVALIGPSGAGKSTIVKLLLRNHDLSKGKILIDSQRILHVSQESLWQNISLVPQDPILFHRTLMENIRYSKPEASDKEVVQAAKLANCHEFITSFPEAYETYVGERGVKLSGGERQRVAIARAILKNSPILILDEATSSLDSSSEHLIQEALDTLMKNKTVIVIAHRLSTIRKMDRIIFIEEGQIKEEGTHEELLNIKNGKYRTLWELQAQGFVA